MGKYDGLEGQKFNRLTILKRTEGKRYFYDCLCDCGKQVSINQYNIVLGTTKSCGCSAVKDLTGQRFGKLVVLERAENQGTKTRWKCRCDCGNIVIKVGSNLKNGDTQSCGCFRNQKTSERSLKDLTNQKFGMLTVLKRVENVGKNTMWLCKCDCGNETVTCGGRLVSGTTKSCGCLKLKGYNWKHEGSNTRIYNIWYSMKQRCYNPNCHAYKWYGARGILMCEEWLCENGFENFRDWSLLNGYEEHLTIDRINNDGNYEPSNCRWATYREQGNNKSINRIIEYGGESHTLSEWSEITGIKTATLHNRIKKGWSYEKCIETSVRSHKKYKSKS